MVAVEELGGKCVFNNGEKCLIYEYKPEGCRIYPVVYDEDEDRIILDEDCPYRAEFKISRKYREKIISLVEKLRDERRQRLRSMEATRQ
ncbi:MAG: YkgJ family cysteine cluster protein [Thermoproteota archaeon]